MNVLAVINLFTASIWFALAGAYMADRDRAAAALHYGVGLAVGCFGILVLVGAVQ